MAPSGMAGKCSFFSCQRGRGDPRNLAAGSWAEQIRFPIWRTDASNHTLPPSRNVPQGGVLPPMQQPRRRGSSLLHRTGVPPHGCGITNTQATPINASMHLVTCSVEALPVKRNKHPVVRSTSPGQESSGGVAESRPQSCWSRLGAGDTRQRQRQLPQSTTCTGIKVVRSTGKVEASLAMGHSDCILLMHHRS